MRDAATNALIESHFIKNTPAGAFKTKPLAVKYEMVMSQPPVSHMPKQISPRK